MRITFVDFETSDLADFTLRARDPRQPHIASASAIVTDENNQEIERFTAIAKEDGWTSAEKARETHGITPERSHAEGIEEIEIIKRILNLIKS